MFGLPEDLSTVGFLHYHFHLLKVEYYTCRWFQLELGSMIQMFLKHADSVKSSGL